MYNPNKVATASATNICITYTDTNKHHWINYETDKNQVTERMIKHRQDTGNLNLSPSQVKQYRVAVYGVEALTAQESQSLSFKERLSITKKQYYAQRMINKWKQQIVSHEVDALLTFSFPKSKITKTFVGQSEYTTDKDVNPFSFKELGITQRDLVNKLIEWNVLPSNFFEKTV